MGIRDDEESPNVDPEDVALLPLYHEHDRPVDSSFDSTLPNPNASAAEVREYLTRLLCHRGVDQDHASSLVARWKTGTGRELRAFPVSMFEKIFESKADTWTVCIAVKTELYREKKQEAYPIVAVLLGLLFFIIFLGLLGIFFISDLSVVIYFFGLAFAVGALGVSITFFYVGAKAFTSPEAQAESDLESLLTK